jgi:hypothetical protein
VVAHGGDGCPQGEEEAQGSLATGSGLTHLSLRVLDNGKGGVRRGSVESHIAYGGDFCSFAAYGDTKMTGAERAIHGRLSVVLVDSLGSYKH